MPADAGALPIVCRMRDALTPAARSASDARGWSPNLSSAACDWKPTGVASSVSSTGASATSADAGPAVDGAAQRKPHTAGYLHEIRGESQVAV
ncbi:MAG TPA: hypothetical protein VFK02_05325 [Kofleriaceae bacterium]|nr:hypothetical protein [Kofleriaceae bacterium]